MIPGFPLKISPPLGSPEKNVLLPSLGEVSIFSSPSSSPDRGEDAYGIGNGGVFIIASSDSLSKSGKKAPQMAVDIVMEHMKKKEANLGDAVLLADDRIREEGEGEETMASAVQVHSDGTVEAAISGTVEIWVLFNDPKGHYGLVPFWTVSEEDQTRNTLGASVIPPPHLVAENESRGMGEVLYGKIPYPRMPGSSEPEHALVLSPGDGILMMTEGWPNITIVSIFS